MVDKMSSDRLSSMSSRSSTSMKNGDTAVNLDIANAVTYSINRKLIITIIFGLMAFASSIFLLLHSATRQEKNQYIPVNPSGKLVSPLPANQPLPEGDVISFSVEAVELLNTYDFENYKKLLIKGKQYFYSQEYWENYLTAFMKSKNIKTVEAKKGIVSFVMTDNPQILSQRVNPNSGAYEWVIEITGQVIYQWMEDLRANNYKNIQDLKFRINVERVITEDNSQILGIKTINIKVDKK